MKERVAVDIKLIRQKCLDDYLLTLPNKTSEEFPVSSKDSHLNASHSTSHQTINISNVPCIEADLAERQAVIDYWCYQDIATQYLKKYSYLAKGNFYFSKLSNFAVCKAPKVGSTFWGTIVFSLLPAMDVKETFKFGRYRFHRGDHTIGFGEVIKRRGRAPHLFTTMVSRDPWSRLYSAWTDKIFLLGKFHVDFAKFYKHNMTYFDGNQCGFTVSFEEFLNKIIIDEQLRKFNEHWQPVATICNPCAIQYDVLSRSETLSRDANFTLNKFPINKRKKEQIQDIISANVTSVNFNSLILDRIEDFRKFFNICPNLTTYMKHRVWPAFKIQGLINKDAPFPSNFPMAKRQALVGNTKPVRKIVDVFFNAWKEHPMSDGDISRQKHEVMVNAYKQISSTTIFKLQQIYALDFLLFDYKLDPPLI